MFGTDGTSLVDEVGERGAGPDGEEGTSDDARGGGFSDRSSSSGRLEGVVSSCWETTTAGSPLVTANLFL